jgi:hypothetical protein
MTTLSAEFLSFQDGRDCGGTFWLGGERLHGGEPILFDETVELNGVKVILQSLSSEELKEMNDCTMPIRYFRAEKVGWKILFDSCCTANSSYKYFLRLASREISRRRFKEFDGL